VVGCNGEEPNGMVACEGSGAGPWSPPAWCRTVPAGDPFIVALGGGSGRLIRWRNTPAARSKADPVEERAGGSICRGSGQEVPGSGGGGFDLRSPASDMMMRWRGVPRSGRSSFADTDSATTDADLAKRRPAAPGSRDGGSLCPCSYVRHGGAM
jgi:hypothetical protein